MHSAIEPALQRVNTGNDCGHAGRMHDVLACMQMRDRHAKEDKDQVSNCTLKDNTYLMCGACMWTW